MVSSRWGSVKVNCSHHGPRISTDTACCGYAFANINASLASQYGDRLQLKIPREGTKGTILEDK